MAIDISFPFKMDPSPERIRESTPEGCTALYNFEAAYPLLFRKIEMFNILLSERKPRHREISNKEKFTREFYTEENVVVRK